MRFWKIYIALCLLQLIFLCSQAQVSITKSDSLFYDANGNLLANPGDSLRYKTKIKNTSGGTVTGAVLDINASGNLNANPGSFKSSPLALDDAYGVTGNVGIMVPAASGLLINDFDDAPGLLTVLAEMKPTAMGGSVTINADGSFAYTPAAGFTGSDNFTYTLQDGNELPGYPAVNQGMVTLNVANMLWFIDNSSVAATSDGRLNSPFKTLANFNASAGPQTGQIVFVKNTGTNYTGGIVLKDNQTLWGTGHTGGANLANVLPFMLAPNSFALPAINGTRPVIENAGGDGVTLALNNALRGFNVGNCSEHGMDNVSGNSIGNLTVLDVNINNGTGGGFDAGNGSGAAMNAVFGSISSTGGVTGILLINCAGTFTGNGGTITNPTGPGAVISGGSVVFSYSGTITDNSGFVIEIDNHDSGNATFSGNITSTGTGIRVQNCNGGTKTFSGASKSLTTTTNDGVTLSNNIGATITFSGGGLVISTTSGMGFNATGGGNISVAGTGNTIATGAGKALNVVNTTIAAAGITFQSIAANGGTNGITLNSTGAGAFTVTGTGAPGSGGTIQNITGDAILLNTMGGLAYFKSMIIQDITSPTDATDVVDTRSGNDGIHGAALTGGLKVEGCTIQRISDDGINGSVIGMDPPASTTFVGLEIINSTIQLCNRFNVSERGDATNEAGVRIVGLSGTVSIKNNTIANCGSGIQIYTASSGMMDVTIQGNAINNINKEFATNPVKRVGLFGLDYRIFGSMTSVIRIGDPNETNAALGNSFLNCAVASIRIVGDNGSITGNTKSVLSKNTFTVTDHTSPQTAPGSMAFNFPQGGVLLRPFGSGNFEAIFSNNSFDQCMHADGGLGNLSLINEGGSSEYIVTGNTFSLTWDAPVELRADGNTGTQASCAVLFQNNVYVDGLVGSAMDDLGAPFQSPYTPFYVQVRNNGRLDLTMLNDILPLHDVTSGFPQSFHCQTTSAGDILNLFLSNVKSPNGFKLQQNAGTTYNLYRGVSPSSVPQTILQDNGCRGGGGNDNTNPPSVTVVGTITPVNVAPVLPSISGF